VGKQQVAAASFLTARQIPEKEKIGYCLLSGISQAMLFISLEQGILHKPER